MENKEIVFEISVSSASQTVSSQSFAYTAVLTVEVTEL